MDKILDLPQIAVLGREGFCTESQNHVQELWKQFREHFPEVEALGMREKNGSFVGFWGAMSDETMGFQPWTNNFSRGYYLAGIEVYLDAEVPEGWTKWIMPARQYLMVEVDFDHYMDTFRDVLENRIPFESLQLCGAVCDYTKPATGQNYLLFPVENRK